MYSLGFPRQPHAQLHLVSEHLMTGHIFAYTLDWPLAIDAVRAAIFYPDLPAFRSIYLVDMYISIRLGLVDVS